MREEREKVFNKQFKDPIYGYIEISSSVVSKIIDTPAFQRLKDIRQTSYTPLYPAAYHNRYVHSLGVYHLGRIAFGAIKPQLDEKSVDTEIHDRLNEIENIFELACLLHDVGHAPFSHTGEPFFLDEEDTLYRKLKESVNEETFSLDFDALGTKKPAPHECMSCVVGLNTFSIHFPNPFDRSLFARCIIGMPIRFMAKAPEFKDGMQDSEKKNVKKQRDAHKAEKQKIELLNCVISLLNSSIIDVDRLDYIIRDAETIGFKNAQVDYMRLLNGIRIVSTNKSLCIGYHKSALSVIESAVYAHDAEKKWVQGHPSILYEMEALKNAMSSLTSIFSTTFDSNPLFCYESLTEKGKNLYISTPLFSNEAKKLFETKELWSTKASILLDAGKLFSVNHEVNPEDLTITREYPVSLLADEDFLYLMKCFCRDGLGHEYFARNRRRSAVWKSEAEFRALFQERIGDDTKSIKILENDFEGLVDYCQSKTGVPIVNEQIFEILDQEESDAQYAKENDEIDADSYEDIVIGVKTKRHWANVLKEIASNLDIEFEYLIVFQKKFSSSFKATIGDIPILFPNLKDGVVPLKNVIDVLKTSTDRKSNFFHLFYKSLKPVDEGKKKQIVNELAEKLIMETNYR